MAVPSLNLNLAPQPSLWRQQHLVIGWSALGIGGLLFLGALGLTWRAYHQAGRAGRDAVNLTTEARRAAQQERDLQATLQTIDATKEQARWKLAERILQERSLPWSRLTAELERCMVPDMRLRSIQKVPGASQQVVLKLKGEARTVAAENAFIAALRQDPVFDQVILEREGERQGGGWDFDMTLPVVPVPPPFVQTPIKASTAPTPGAPTAPPVPPRKAEAPKAAPTPSAHPQRAIQGAAPLLRPAGSQGSVVEKPAPPTRRFPGIRQRPRHPDEGGAE
ncbi:MAG TPA: hypothetical protein VF768_00180 [Holophagaceae bacterium]